MTARQCLQTAVVVELLFDILYTHFQFAREIANQPRVNIPAARAHHQPFQGRHAHGGVHRHAIVDGTHAGTVTQVAAYQAQKVMANGPILRYTLSDVLVRDSMKTVATHSLVAPHLRYGIGGSIVGHSLVKCGVKHGHLRQCRPQ